MNDDLRFFKQAVRMGLLDGGTARDAYRVVRDGGSTPQAYVLGQGLLGCGDVDRILQAMSLDRAPQRRQAPPPPAGGVAGYVILAQLGAGGMGAVYRAEHQTMRRPVALKILASQYARDEAFVLRFMREARAAGRVNDRHVVACYDAGRDGETLYMALELIEGGDAHQLLDVVGSIAERRVLEIGRDCAIGLVAIEAAGLVHRDIKPSNILLTTDGIAKLGDLGLARQMTDDDNLSVSGEIFGTPAYMSPEHARGDHDLDIRTDIYSLGASLYTLLTGSQPFIGQSSLDVASKVLHAPVPDPRELRRDCSREIAHLLMRMMSKDRSLRHDTPADLVADLQSMLDHGRPVGGASRGGSGGGFHLAWNGTSVVVSPDGMLGQGDTPRWDLTLAEIDGHGAQALIVDCGSVEMITSEGLALFVRLRGECEQRGLRFAICKLNESTHRAICIVQLDRILPLYASLDEALAAAAAA